ncbi:hypothetical protein SEA_REDWATTLEHOG_175 [Gordonia phage RedWattleHog]|uniref:Uncharacterized protein n=1 Tax=Gordonia phage Stormageddon TaxID=2656541 RepID=A0A649VRD7_9CAUD|nr:hypothetical protein KHQ86_gp124 [Gordonia phage Stormageddon]QGJ95036.1 hypothetical protein SEA_STORMAGEDDON_176 [Gordonia phage Stormageddon]QLF83678.1 hypothetical protein SEA_REDWATTLEHOG_175 [Gordonia phage RedWattleHog]
MTTGEQLRDEGMQQVDETHTAWREHADQVMAALIELRRPFSANDFNEHMAAFGLEPHHPSSIGALFGGYAKRGLIVRCGTARPTKASSHARTYAQWIAADVAFPSTPEANLRRALAALSDIRARVEAASQTPVDPYDRDGLMRVRSFRECLDIVDDEIDRRRDDNGRPT